MSPRSGAAGRRRADPVRLTRSNARTEWRRFQALVDLRPSWLLLIAGMSIAVGVSEAAVLALVVQIAASMSNADVGDLSLGPVGLDHLTIGTMFVIALIITFARFGLQLATTYLPARATAERQVRLRQRLSSAYLRARWSTQAAEPEGRLQDLLSVQVVRSTSAINVVAGAIGSICTFAALAASAMLVSPLVAATILGLVLTLFVALRPLARVTKRFATRHSAASQAFSSEIAGLVAVAEEIKTFGVAEPRLAHLGKVNDDVRRPQVQMQVLTRGAPATYQALTMLFVIGGLAVLWAVSSAKFASLGAVVLMLMRGLSYSQQIQSAYLTLQEFVPYVELVTSALTRFEGSAERYGDVAIERPTALAFEHVSFAYRDGVPVLRDVSFSIAHGEAVGIVGPSGAGKSTIVQLLLGLRHPDEGSVVVDGVELTALREGTWSSLVAFVPQDTKLLTGTVEDNIRFFRPAISSDAVVAAAVAAGIHDEIMAWPDGYATPVGQRVDAVSGGQRQRICLARALAGSPHVLVLDEPTSALDARSERIVRDSLRALRSSVTLVIVAHRDTTLDMCDRLLSVDGGRVELLERDAAS